MFKHALKLGLVRVFATAFSCGPMTKPPAAALAALRCMLGAWAA